MQCCGVELEETFTLTKSEIIENKDKTLKEMFKDVFEVELEVGKWYKTHNNNSFLLFATEIKDRNNVNGYGINYHGKWLDKTSDFSFGLNEVCLATEEEVKTALINEAKRKYKGKEIKCLYESNEPVNKDFNKWYFDSKSNMIYTQPYSFGGKEIFNNGKWAEIIETITKEEAEKQLNKKIV